jgi:hypothetical protein
MIGIVQIANSRNLPEQKRKSRIDKAESAAGLSFKKKNWNFAQWQMMMVTLRRVYMSQSAEPFRIDSSQSAQFFSRNSIRFQPVGSAMSNRFRKN